MPMPRRTIIEGQRFGNLTVLGEGEPYSWGGLRLICRCDCGGETLVCKGSLLKGVSTHCGCMAKARRGASHITHGFAYHPLWKIWNNMMARCYREENGSFSRYGGRGIRVCEQWKSFEAFCDDMGPRPAGTTIERINNNGNYEPGNCKWATKRAQSNNRRNNHFVTVGESTKTLVQWADMYGTKASTIQARIRNGWLPAEAVETPTLNTWSRRRA
jgi:hypothetical protein